MRRRLDQFAWVGSSACIAANLLIFWLGGALACESNFSAQLGPDRLRVRHNAEAVLKEQSVYLDPVPVEVARAARENLPMMQKFFRLDPVRGPDLMIADAYLGSDYASQSPDVFVMLRDPRALCILAPATVVFLSDGSTHHFATIDEIDATGKTITLADRWAPVSFLLPGRNLLGIRAELVTTGAVPRLRMSTEEFLRALRGFVETWDPLVLFSVIETNYPEIANNEDYLFWKYSRIIGSGQFDVTVNAIVELSARYDLLSKPRIQLLLDFARDMTGTVTSGLAGQDVAGRARKMQAREAFFNRIEFYGRLPWLLRWLLVDRSAAASDMFLLSVLDHLPKTEIDDVDFQIARAQVLIRLERPFEALDQANAAERQWASDIVSLIPTNSPENSTIALFNQKIDLVSYNVAMWRYARIVLAKLNAKVLADPGAYIEYQLGELTQLYSGAELTFLDAYLHLYSLKHDESQEAFLLEEAISQATQIYERQAKMFDTRLTHIANALYQHFMLDRPIDLKKPTDLQAIESEALHHEICRLAEIRPLIHANERAAAAMTAACQARQPRGLR